MKSKFLAGTIATLIALVFVTGLTVFLVLVIDVEPSKNWFTYTAAILTISVWLGIYSWLKPKDPPDDQYKDGKLPSRHT